MGAVMINNHILSKWHQRIHPSEVQSHTALREEKKAKKILSPYNIQQPIAKMEDCWKGWT